MKLRITVLNKPELVARLILEALEVAELFKCGITVRYHQGSRKEGAGFNFIPLGKGPVSELEILITENNPGQVLEAVQALMSRQMGRNGPDKLN